MFNISVSETLAEREAQCSMTDAYRSNLQELNSRDGGADIPKYRHYRIVLGTVGYDLQHLRGTDELLRATYDVFQGKYTSHSGSLLLIEHASHQRCIHTGETSPQRC